jgi:hypothetical protein
VVRKELGDVDVVYHSTFEHFGNESVEPFEMAHFARVLIYREAFVIFFSLYEPDAGHQFEAEQKRIVEKSIELIDLRFPEGETN